MDSSPPEGGGGYFPRLDLPLILALSFLISLLAVKIKTNIWSKSFAIASMSFASPTVSPPCLCYTLIIARHAVPVKQMTKINIKIWQKKRPLLKWSFLLYGRIISPL